MTYARGKPKQTVDLSGLAPKDVARFKSKVVRNGPGECWGWVGCTKKRGYARFKFKRHVVAAHRVAYFIEHGSLPIDVEVDHTCLVVDCVNPAHLEAVRPEENRRRRVEHYKEALRGEK